MTISVITCQLVEALEAVRKEGIFGETKDTEERIYEIVESAIIDRDDIKDTIFEDYEGDFALAGFSQPNLLYLYACDKLPPNKENNKSYILQQVININQYNGCSFYEGYPLKEPPKKFSTRQWLIEQLKWLIDKVCIILKL